MEETENRPTPLHARDSSEAGVINVLILLCRHWGITCHCSSPEQNFYPQNSPRSRSGFSVKAKVTVIILLQHHLPSADLHSTEGDAASSAFHPSLSQMHLVLHVVTPHTFCIRFSFPYVRYPNNNIHTFLMSKPLTVQILHVVIIFSE